VLPFLRFKLSKGEQMAERLNNPGWATYLRVSDEDKQSPERSFAMQRQRIQENLFQDSTVPFFAEYKDMLTGTSPNRSEYLKLMADAEAGRFSHLGLYRADRFGRDTVEGLQAATKLMGWGIKIRMAHMPSLMPESPDGFFMFLLQMGMAQREVDVLKQRTSDGMEVKMRAGGWAHKAPEGYINKERAISSNKYERWVEQNPQTISMVKDAFDLLLTDRYTLDQICEELAASGYTRSNGMPWVWNDAKTGLRKDARNRLSYILHNPFYAGWMVSEKFGIKLGEVKGIWEPIITHEEYQKGLSILKKHDMDKSRDRRYFYLLKGLLWVSVDGKAHKMSGSSPVAHNRLYPYYTTQSKPLGSNLHVKCEIIDEQVPSWLEGISISENRIPPIREEYRRQVTKFKENDLDVQSKKIQNQLSQLRGEESRLGRLFITGKISEESYNQLRLEWQENIRVVEAKLAAVERNVGAVMVDLDVAILLLSKCSILFNRLDEKGKGRLLKILAKRIIIDPDGLIINQELNSPFTYLRSLAEGLEVPSGSTFCGSEQVRLGALKIC
jgi:DNA invertase Pin-like site-specific DNA recombinase